MSTMLNVAIFVGKLKREGIDLIYANQLFLASWSEMRKCADRILECGRALEKGDGL